MLEPASLIREAVRHFLEHGGGTVISLSSSDARESRPGGPFDDPEGPGGYREPRNYEVVGTIAALVAKATGIRSLFPTTSGTRSCLNHYGGHGLAHIGNHVVRYLKDSGLTDDQVDQTTVHTPRAAPSARGA